MRDFLHCLLFGIAFGAGGAVAGFLIGVALSYSTWLDKMGLDGPPAGVAFVMLILLLAVVAGAYGFLSALTTVRRRQNNPN